MKIKSLKLTFLCRIMLMPSIADSRDVIVPGGAWFIDGPTSRIMAIASYRGRR